MPRIGSYARTAAHGETVNAYLPPPLPPSPPLALSVADQDLHERANRALGRLDGVASILPDTALFLYTYVRKEAVLSSQIEGTQSTLVDLLLYESKEAPGVPIDDVEEVSTYVAAMHHGLRRLRSGFPLSLRLIREIHEKLLATGRGSGKAPGEFRRTQNWIGGTRPGNAAYVPPPPDRVLECMGLLEKFLHDEPDKTPLLIKAALAHVQFETVHPFLDGNGRVGRLLITLLLCAEGALGQPLLYLSLWFKQHRARYYELLQRVRVEGDWEEWVRFFLEGVLETSEQATSTARRTMALFKRDRDRIGRIGRASGSALRLHELLCQRVIMSIPRAARTLQLTKPTVAVAVENLRKAGIVDEVTGRRRGKLYVYRAYLDILDEGTEPIRARRII